jgi:hypothetical protein
MIRMKVITNAFHNFFGGSGSGRLDSGLLDGRHDGRGFSL